MSDSIRVGVLFSQTGLFGSTEAEHLRGAILALDEINQQGGIAGRLVEPVIADPCSDPVRLRRLAQELIVHEEVVSLFGCAASPMRKALLPVVERHNAMLWYPTQFEGFEYSPNVMYGGPCPNQYVLPLAEYFKAIGAGRIALLGSDYLFPRECNRVMRHLVHQYGAEIVHETYLPLGADRAALKTWLVETMRDPPDVIFSTLVGPSALAVFESYRDGGYSAATTPIATICATESEIAQAEPQLMRGHLCSLPYFESLQTPENQAFVRRLRTRYGPAARANFMIESAYVQMHLFALAAAQAARWEVDALREASSQVQFMAPHGRVRIDADSQHSYHQSRIGRGNGQGQFDLVADVQREIRPDPYLVAVP